MNRRWVVNASPLIVLAKIDMVWLLEKLCDHLVIPSGVVEEINDGPIDDPARKWIDAEGNRYKIDVRDVPSMISAWDLGKGESQVLAWVHLNKDYDAILDDRAARNCADAPGIRVIGTLGLIVFAYRNKLIAEVAPVFKKLQLHGFRVNPNLISHVINSLQGRSNA